MNPAETRSWLEAHLIDARAAGRKLLVPFLTTGFPDVETCRAVLEALAERGADAIELGVPFSDPLADGPVIAAASERALEEGVTLASSFNIGREYASPDRPPLVLFTYANPLMTYGIARSAEKCLETGFGGILIADLPYDEDREMRETLREIGLPVVRLAAPTTPEARLRDLATEAEGFIYLIARTGVTGEGAGADKRTVEQLAVLREETDLPVVVGFGIADSDSARSLAKVADGIVVGSALIDRIRRQGTEPALDWFSGLREALDSI